MVGPHRTPGQGRVPDYYTYRARAQQDAARRAGYPGVRIPHLPPDGATRYDWSREVVDAFERGASLALHDWNLLDGHTRRALRNGRRAAGDEETARVLDLWDPTLRPRRPPTDTRTKENPHG